MLHLLPIVVRAPLGGDEGVRVAVVLADVALSSACRPAAEEGEGRTALEQPHRSQRGAQGARRKAAGQDKKVSERNPRPRKLLPPQEARRPAPTTPTDDTYDAGRRMEIGASMHIGHQPSHPRRAAKQRGRQVCPETENFIRSACRHCGERGRGKRASL